MINIIIMAKNTLIFVISHIASDFFIIQEHAGFSYGKRRKMLDVGAGLSLR